MPTLLDEKRHGGARVRSRRGIPVLEESWEFLVLADHERQTRTDILLTDGLPFPGYTTSSGGFTVCVSTDAKRRSDSVLYWDVSATFSSEVEENQSGPNGDPRTDPVSWVPVYETKFERYTEVVTKDFSGNSIANSAGQPFEYGLSITRHIPIWEFFQFESGNVTDEQIIARSETVNSGIFKGRAAKTLLCIVLSSVVGFYYGQRRRLTHYQLKYNSKKWTHKRLDVGTQYLDGAALKDFKSEDGTIMLGSLDGTGGKQTAGTAPAVLEFDQYDTSSFSFLRI